MANLSNINGKFVVEQTTGYVGVGTTDPNFLIEAAGANSEIALNSTSASIYRVRSTSNDEFMITKNGVGDRLVIAGNGNATFAGTLTAPSFKFNENIYKIESTGATRGLYSAQPHGGDYYTQTSTKTGYLKIVLPPTTNVDDMVKFTVDIYLYGVDTELTAHIGGYLTSSLGWGNTAATIVSGNTSLNYTVRFGNDGSNYCVYIGEDNTTWSYPQVVIRNFFAGYGAVSTDNYLSEWTVDFTTTLGTISETRTNNFPLSSGSTSDGVWTVNGNNIYNSNSGNVGIGVTGPLSPLSIQANSGGSALRFIGRSDGISGIDFFNSTQTVGNYFQSNGTWIRSRADGGFHFSKGSTPIINDVDGFTIEGMNVGIGTDAPEVKLDVQGSLLLNMWGYASGQLNEQGIFFRRGFTVSNKYNSSILVYDHSGTGNTPEGISINGYDGVSICTGSNTRNERMRITSAGGISFGSSGTAYGTSGQVLTSNGNAAPTWEDASGGSSPWTTSGNDIYNNNSGSVGVNNTSPSSHYSNYNQLVVGNGTNNQGMTIFAGSNDESSINFTDTTSTFSNNFIIKVDHNDTSESNNSSFQINYENNRYVTINKQTNGSNQVPQVRLGMFNSSSLPANLDHSMLEIGINNGMNNPGMVMYGDSQGNSNPFIGMVSTSGSSQITTKFFRFYHNTTLCGTIQKRYNANEVQYLTTSDYRLKEDLKPFKALDTICKINVYNYKWKDIEGDNVNYGVLAHELQELIPEVVAGEKDEVTEEGEAELQGVDYSKLVPHLIQSIQELKADNDSLKARIETLENN